MLFIILVPTNPQNITKNILPTRSDNIYFLLLTFDNPHAILTKNAGVKGSDIIKHKFTNLIFFIFFNIFPNLSFSFLIIYFSNLSLILLLNNL